MNWKKKTLLAVVGATALVGVTASASAGEWGFYFSPQTTSYYDHDRSDNGGYYSRHDNRTYGRDHDYRSRYWRHHAYDRGGRGYDNNRTYGARSWNNNDGYVQQNCGYSYGRNDDDD